MNDVALYFLNSAAWSAVGFAAGWAYAREWRREHATQEEQADHHDD